MDAGIEKECSALGGLFQVTMNDMKASYPTWEDFVTKGTKLQSQLRTTITMTGAFLDAFQKVADMATASRGATKDIGSALTRMCMRHRSIESKLKLFTTALSESLINPLELKMEEWKKVASQLDKDHAKEYKKARADLKKKSSDTIKLQKKVKKGKDEARGQLDSALQDVNVRYAVLEETEKRAVCRALIEERARYCSFVSLLKPVLDHEINMLGEVTHLQTILEDLISLTAEPNKLPPSSEQVILDLKGSEFNFAYQTPPSSPSSTLSRKSSISSSYQSGSVRHVPSLDSISAVDGLHIEPQSSPSLSLHSEETGRSLSEGSAPSRRGSCGRHGYALGHGPRPTLGRRAHSRGMSADGTVPISQLASGGIGEAENGFSAPPPKAHVHHRERGRAMSTCGKSGSGQDQLTLTLAALSSDAPRSSRDSLHCSSGYSTQTTTPSCSEDTIHSHVVTREPSFYVDYESISLHGDVDSVSLHHLTHDSNFDKSSTIPRNSDLSFQLRMFAQSKRPTSTVSLLAEPELTGRSAQQLASNTATIRRKPSSKPAYRRGTISGGVPIPICTPQIPRSVPGGNGGSHDNIFIAPPAGGAGLGYSKLCTSTQSLSALASSSSPYYQLIPGQMPIPVPVPTIPAQPLDDSAAKQPLPQLNSRSSHLLQHQAQQQFQVQQQQGYRQLQTNPPVHQQQFQAHQYHPYQQQQQQRAQLQASAASTPAPSGSAQPQAPASPAESHGVGLLSQIRSIRLKRTITDDRSAPLLPSPSAPK